MLRKFRLALSAFVLGTLAVTVPGLSAAATGTTERVSLASDGTQANTGSQDPQVSADGRYVAFQTGASNLVDNDTNGAFDVFVYDKEMDNIERVHVATDGTQANGGSSFGGPVISASGRYVAFSSAASNLVDGDTNGALDVFVHDRDTGATERVSVASGGTEANGSSFEPTISGDGRYVAFVSAASNLVDGDTNPGDVFVHDRDTGTTERVSVASGGTEANGSSTEPKISADGRHVAFQSTASNLVPGDTNARFDVFVHDRETVTTERVSVSTRGVQASGHSTEAAISGDGRYVAFRSSAPDLVPEDTNSTDDVFVRDRSGGVTERVSLSTDGLEANGPTTAPVMSIDGRYVAFRAFASNLVLGDTNGVSDVLVRDRQAATTDLASVSTGGAQANGTSTHPAISADGRHVAFVSDATNLVAGDSNGVADVFVHDLGPADAIAPQVSITNPPDGVSYSLDEIVLADYACSDEVGGSGLASCQGVVTAPDGGGISVADGAALPTGALGGYSITVTATDTVGNTTSTSRDYTVFTGGLEGPADPPPTVNTSRAGARVPVVFSLGADNDLDIFAAGFPKSQRIDCDALVGDPSEPLESTTSTPGGLHYDTTSDQYTYVWVTDRAWQGSCRQLKVRFADNVPGYAGAQMTLYFRFL